MFQKLNDIISAVVTEFRKNFVGALAKGLLALVVASAVIVWSPIYEYVVAPAVYFLRSAIVSRGNITTSEAQRIAQWQVGNSSVYAIPFRNSNNPNQLIAVWSSDDDCNAQKLDCNHGAGAVYATILEGSGKFFSRRSTGIPALPVHYGPDAITFDDNLARYASMVDRNSDGVMEILAISDEAAFTSSYNLFQVNLFDTGSENSIGATYLLDRNGRVSSEYTTADSEDQAWLRDRFDEFLASLNMDDCIRGLNGHLNCKTTRGEDEELDSPDFEEIERLWGFYGELTSLWAELNGIDFTLGDLQLAWRDLPSAVNLDQQACVLIFGDYRIYNYFKGPLLVMDTKRATVAALYLQDGLHHREIPFVAVSENYVWLGLAYKNEILTINRDLSEVIGVAVTDWHDGIPGEWDDSVTLDEEVVASEEYEIWPKELQVGLRVSADRMVYGDPPVTLTFDDSDLNAERFQSEYCVGSSPSSEFIDEVQ